MSFGFWVIGKINNEWFFQKCFYWISYLQAKISDTWVAIVVLWVKGSHSSEISFSTQSPCSKMDAFLPTFCERSETFRRSLVHPLNDFLVHLFNTFKMFIPKRFLQCIKKMNCDNFMVTCRRYCCYLSQIVVDGRPVLGWLSKDWRPVREWLIQLWSVDCDQLFRQTRWTNVTTSLTQVVPSFQRKKWLLAGISQRFPFLMNVSDFNFIIIASSFEFEFEIYRSHWWIPFAENCSCIGI